MIVSHGIVPADTSLLMHLGQGISKGSGQRGGVQLHEVYPWFQPIPRPFRPF